MSVPEISLVPLGGGREIGANAYLLRWGDAAILLDAGLHPCREGYDALPLLGPINDLGSLDAIVVTHGHLDHSGSLPYLVKEYRPAAVFMTEATSAVVSRMLHNTVSIMAIHSYEACGNPHLYEEYYSHQAVDQLADLLRFHSQSFGEWFHVCGPVRGYFFEAGHVLGAAGVALTDGTFTLVYTGDISLNSQEIHPAARLPRLDRPVDLLLTESTYGSDEHACRVAREREVKRFAKRARKALRRGGNVLVPAFALGRTQEMLSLIHRLMATEELPPAPIRISGLGRAMNEIYDTFSHELRRSENGLPRLTEGYSVLDIYPRGDRWAPPDTAYVRHQVSRLLQQPSIIIATNGMMKSKTPSAYFAEQMITRPEDAILFVGYLDQDELGARVLDAKPGDELLFEHQDSPVRVACNDIGRYYFTAHAHREDLLRVAAHFKPVQALAVHGEPASVAWMQENLAVEGSVHAPEVGEQVLLPMG